MILATAVEFTNKQQAGVKDRRSDDIYLNQLVKQLEHSIKIETREPPFNQTYVAKTRLLIHAYLEHVELQDPGLIQDQAAIVKYSPFLINEMMLILNQIWSYAKMYKGNRMAQKKVPEPSLDMYESVMRLSQIIVQSLWLPFQPLLQLPHINNEQLKFFFHKKRRINTIEEFANLKSDERRRLLKNLSDEEYHDIIVFCQTYPHIEMKVETEVPDDEDSSLISAGSFVNIKVYLRRCSLLEQGDDTIENEIMSNINQSSNPPNDDNIIDNDSNKEIIEGVMPETLVASEVASKETSNKGGKGGGKKPKKKGKVQQKKKPQNVRKRPQQEQNKEEHNKKQEQTNDIKKENNRESDVSEDEDREGEGLDDEDKEWKELQKSIRKEKEQMKNQIDTSSLVHAPYFPADKHELWWVCVADRKTNSIVVPPQKVTGLKNEKEVTLKMMAERKGLFKYVVILTSDSYLNCTIQQELKVQWMTHYHAAGKLMVEKIQFHLRACYYTPFK
jgi:translocation protein SEC63